MTSIPQSSDFLNLLDTIFEDEGARTYLGESVSISEHMIQAAQQAQKSDAPDSLVAAALLHDIGYFTRVRLAHDELARQHDEIAAAFLSSHFGPEVTEPVRLHVQAKRYLCAVEPDYLNELSDASVRTLNLQGGPMSDEETCAFEANPYHRDALRVRRYDDQGKVDSAITPVFANFRHCWNVWSSNDDSPGVSTSRGYPTGSPNGFNRDSSGMA